MRKAMAAALTGLALAGLAGTASAQVTQQDFPWPPNDITPIHKTKAELQKQADELTAHQLRTYPQIFAGAKFVAPGLWGGLRDGVLDDGMQYMANVVRFRQPGAEQGEWTGVITQVNAPGFFTDSPAEFCAQNTCTGTVSDNRGGVIVFSEDDRYNDRSAHNFRPNGEVVFTQVSRQDDPALLGAVASDRAYTFTR
jgi:hypothetical protein